MTRLKKLPLLRRPFFARRILEVGGGHAPYQGVTHAVDKFPSDDTQRAGRLEIAPGVSFIEGDLERLPFPAGEKFDYVIVSHVFEHVADPARAVAELNRIAPRGYLETPSPLREQIASAVPVPTGDYHRLFCWGGPEGIHVVLKSPSAVGEFCSCEAGKLASRLFDLHRARGMDVEPWLPGTAKTTRVFFRAPLALRIHASLRAACAEGACAYASAREAARYAAWPYVLVSPRFRRLREILRGGMEAA